MRRMQWKALLTWGTLACLVAGCGVQVLAPTPSAGEPLPLTAATATLLPTRTPAPTATLLPAPTITPAATPVKTVAPPTRPPSGWTLFSNPDFVQGVALHETTLWAATLGGVVRWNLDTQTPTLFTTRDGLVDIQGNDIVACAMPDPQILVAHESGILSAYNLSLDRWSRVPITFDDGATLKSVQTLHCDQENNRLLVGSPEGVGIFDYKSGRWRLIGREEGLPVETIRAIDVVGQTIWVAAGNQSAFMIMGNTIFPFNGASGFPSGPINDLSVAPDLSIWFGYPTGLVHYREKKWNSYGNQTPAGIPFLSVDHVEAGLQNTIWIASAEDGICPFDVATLVCSTIYQAPPGAPVTDLIVDASGVAYAGTRGAGVVVLLPEQRINLALKSQQLLSNEVTDIAESQDGKLWLATSLGVNILDPERSMDPWQAIQPTRNGLAFPRVSNLQPAAEGMWIFYDEESQASFTGKNGWLHLNTVQGLSAPVLDSTIDQRGYIWFASPLGIDIWDGAAMRSYGPTTGLSGNVFQALFEQDGEVWVGTDRGLLVYRRYQWLAPLPGIAVNAIIQNPAGGLLLGTDQGLVRFDGGQSYQWIINLGEEVVMNPRVTTLSWDLQGHLWIGTFDQGLFHFDGSRWEQFDTTRGMPANHIRKIYTDRLGAVWIAAVTGPDGGALMRYMP
jgi:ligand-binding sensor domain-containing protein